MRGLRRGAAGLAMVGVVGLVLSCGDDEGPTDNTEDGSIEVTVTADGSAREGVTIELFESGGATALSSAVTDASGAVEFTALDPGSYEVEVEIPAGLELASGQARRAVSVPSGGRATATFVLVTAAGNVVEITLTSGLRFDPAEVTIEPGTTVRWVNGASIFHTITPDGHSEWTRATMSSQGEVFTHTFDATGSFPYLCEPHESSGMTGTITVQ
ncbi:MAG: hypothetical protein GWM90_14230 [Gemmatimonadetes bacterium]|nr:hypothetical protein [Gemmatimonadota bacterium]NIQ55306.1 hypothetical protein [Gemmatimonadota bacterium]NIU75506.1 hypothetical protein [Gammaproteobacteria bacterium]NIX45226.1 hypothetical protein [Gemmatimonadota bacterium]NIY09483.1 hypothetical protein [Gemmatimonadota bacterium]